MKVSVAFVYKLGFGYSTEKHRMFVAIWGSSRGHSEDVRHGVVRGSSSGDSFPMGSGLLACSICLMFLWLGTVGTSSRGVFADDSWLGAGLGKESSSSPVSVSPMTDYHWIHESTVQTHSSVVE